MPNSNESRWISAAGLERSATILLIVVTVVVGGLTVWDRLKAQAAEQAPQASAQAPSGPTPKDPLSIDGAPSRGYKGAKVALIVFSEFECPYCARSALDVVPEIERRYIRAGKLLFVWRHFPLPIHKNARIAAEAAECAGVQDKFWEFHDWAFRNQSKLDRPNLDTAAKGLDLDMSAFGVCLGSQGPTAKVEADLNLAKELAVQGTPTWFVGIIRDDGRVHVTERLDGSRAGWTFQNAIERALAAAASSNTPAGS